MLKQHGSIDRHLRPQAARLPVHGKMDELRVNSVTPPRDRLRIPSAVQVTNQREARIHNDECVDVR